MNTTRLLDLVRRLPIVLAALAITTAWSASALAQVSVTATAGTLGPTSYTTLGAAFTAINAGTHQGAITVAISANTTEGTTPATLNSSGAGSASYTSVLVQPTADGVSVSGNPITGFGVVQLNGADNVTINGDNPNSGGTNRNLTIANTTTATVIANSAVRIAVSSAVTTADNNTIKNLILNGNVTAGNASGITSTTGSSNSSFGIYVGGNGGATATGAPTAITSVTAQTAPSGTTVNNLVIDNNQVNQCARAIVFNGAVTTVSNGVTITNNVIGASGSPSPATPPYTSPSTTVYTKGIWVAGTASINVTGNTVQNLMSYVATTNTCVELVSPIGASVTIANNTITNHTSNGTTSNPKSILVSNASTSYTISGNTITGTQSLAGASGCDAIECTAAVTSGTIENNKITQVYNRNTGTWGAYGINLTSGSNVTVRNNFISDLKMDITSGGAFSTTFGIFGIRLANTAAANTKVYHNSVNLSGALLGTSTTSILTTALGVTSTSATGIDARNNILSNTLTGGTTSIAHVSLYLPSGATSAMNLTLNNNAYYSGADPARQGIGQTGTTAGTGFYLASNFNNGATTPASNLRAYTSTLSAAGTNDNGSLAFSSAAPFTSATDLHIPAATATPLESGGASVPVTLDIDGQTRPGPPGSVNGGGTANDIGADEFDGTPAGDVTVPAITYTPLSPTSSTSNLAFTNVVITDASGVNGTPGTRPRVYYKKSGDANAFVDNTAGTNGWKYAESNGGTSPFDFTIDYSLLFSAPVIAGDVIQYFVVAQDAASPANVAINSGTFAANPSSVNLGAAQFPLTGTIRSYTIVGAPLSGDYTVGTGSFAAMTGIAVSFEQRVETVTREVLEPVVPQRGENPDQLAWRTVTKQVEQVTWVPIVDGRTYTGPLYKKRNEGASFPNATLAGSYATITAAVNDLNLRGVSGPVRFLLTDTTYPTETFPITVNVTSANVPTAANPVTIKPNAGVVATVSGAAASTSIFKVFNTNYVTIDGSNTIGGTTRDLTISNTSATSPIVVWLGSSGTTPITNDALKNCVVRNGINTNSAVVVSDGTTAGNQGYFSDITIQNNKVQNAYIAVYTNGGTTPQTGANLNYIGNDLSSTGADAIQLVGLYLQGVNGAIIRNNDIGNFVSSGDDNDAGIWAATGSTNVTISANRIHDIVYTGVNGYSGKGIKVSTGQAAANVTIVNNMLSNMKGDGDSYASFGSTYNPVGIYVFGTGQGGVSVFDNSIYLFGQSLNFSSGAYSIGIALDDGAAARVSGNNVVNNLGRTGSTGAGAVALALETSAAQLTNGDRNNLYCASTGGGTNNIGKIAGIDYPTMAGWRTASSRDSNSVSGDPFYVSTSDLHINTSIPSSPVSGAGALLGIATDYDGDTRDASTPDIGADEFTYITITASAGPGGSISPSGAVAVNLNGNQTFTITPNTCFQIADVLVDGSSVGAVATYTFTNVTANHTIAASFTGVAPYTITASAGAGGAISPNGAVSVACGGSQTFTITPDGCHTIGDVLVDGSSVGAVASYTFTNVLANHTIAASFTVIPYTITASAGANGSISPSGAVVVNCGDNQSFSFAANSDYYVADVIVDGSSVGASASYTFTNVTSNRTISVTFAQDLATIAVQSTATEISGSNPCVTVPVTLSRLGGTPVLGFSVKFQLSANLQLCSGTSSVTEGTFLSASGSTVYHVLDLGGGLYQVDDAVIPNCGPTATSGTLFSIGVTSSSPSGTGTITLTSLKLRDCSNAVLSTAAGAPATVPINNGFATITASAGPGGTISPSGAVSVTIGGSQTFTITPDGCHSIADVLVDGSSVGAVSSYTFTNVTSNHTIAASFATIPAAVPAVTSLASSQVRTGNDTDGTTKITVSFTAPGGTTVEVWRRGFGGYPQYDGAGGAAPASPASYPPAGWTLTAVTASGQTDEPSARDSWYFVAYAKDACGNVSPASNLTGGALNYHLGDVSDGVTQGQGDNKVNVADLSLLGAHYGVSGAALAGFEYLDVGPTTTTTVLGRPTTDGKTNFEDLVMFALNYTPVASLVSGKGGAQASAANVLALGESRAAVTAGESFAVPVELTGGGDLQAVSVALSWDAAIVEPVGVDAGELVTAAGGVALSPEAGAVDVAALGTGSVLAGRGTVAVVRFRALASGDPRLGVARVTGRDAANRPVAVLVGSPAGVPGRAAATDLQPVIPNPMTTGTVLQYGLTARGSVDLSIYSVDGRRVATLAHGVQEAGQYRVSWNGTDERGGTVEAGVYFVRFTAPGTQRTRLVTKIR